MGILDIITGAAGPEIDRVRHGPKQRRLRVERREWISPGMLRLVLSGADLADFASQGFDDHLKVYVPRTGDRRDYTPRRFDAAANELSIDFALHGGGAVTDWIVAVEPGETVEISGPKGSATVQGVRRWILVGDESALQAIGRCVEGAAPGVEITTLVAVSGSSEQQQWMSRGKLTQLWAHRPLAAAADASGLVRLLADIEFDLNTFVWIAGEAGVARTVRDYVAGEKGHPRSWIKAGGYWVIGRSGGKERL